MKKLFCFLTIFLCFHKGAQSQSAYSVPTKVKIAIDSNFHQLRKQSGVMGVSVAIIDKGEIVFASGYGWADKANAIKATENTVFRVGSVTKSFTSLSIMQLHEKGLLHVDSSARKYLTDLTIASRFDDNNQFTLRDILSHLAGLPGEIFNGFLCDAPPNGAWLIQELNKQTTICPKRYKHAYSNVGYGLLGEVISRTSGLTYEQYLRKNIFEPLHMNSSVVVNKALVKPEAISKGYDGNDEVVEPLIRDQSAGLVHSTVLDMAAFIKLMLNNGVYEREVIVSKSSIIEMKKNHLTQLPLNERENWGLGLYTKNYLADGKPVELTGHSGDTYAFHADYGFIPELNVGAVILTNSTNGREINAVSNLLKLYLAKAHATELRPLPVALPNLEVWEKPCSDSEIMGDYNNRNFLMRVADASKIKVKQGPASIVFSKSASTQTYSVKAVLLGIIPVKMNDMLMQFVKINHEVVVKSIDRKSNTYQYQAVKEKPSTGITPVWAKRLGTYTIRPGFFACTNCDYGDYTGMTLELSEKGGYVMMKTSGKTDFGKTQSILAVISNTLAVTGGLGRDTGTVLRVMDNGNLYFSGLEFTLQTRNEDE